MTKKNIQKPLRKKTVCPSKDKALLCAQAASNKKARDIRVLDVRTLTDITDFFVICSADNTRQALAIADEIQQKLKSHHMKAGHKEGSGEANWVLLDCYDVIIHIFLEEARGFYRIEDLWAEAKQVTISNIWPAFGEARSRLSADKN